ncbi:outer membrane protein assembly factor BamA [Chlamydiifrater phoenicopteri]|uniref:outer membrane protein assembly factor BamA n=1 Tax=Chlamydiifrater phoenicopteri TaxID=2681469 RepID=UPI001BCD6E40
MKDKRNFLFLLFLLQSSITMSAEQIIGDNRSVVDKVEIVVEGKRNRSRHKTPEIKVKEGSLFSQTEFDKDLRDLSKDYDRVEPQVSFSNGKAHLKVILIEKPVIRKIEVVGNKEFSEYKILRTLQLTRDTQFEREKFLKSFETLRTSYLKRGFFESDLSYELDHDESLGVIDIKININEGVCGRIKKLKLCGLNKSERNDVQEFMVTKAYSPCFSWFTGAGLYHPEMIEQDAFGVTNYLQNLGYADAKVEIQQETDCKGNIILCFDVKKGPKYRLGHVHVEGFACLPRKAVEKQMLVGSGDLFCSEKIWTSSQKIRDLYAKYGYINANVDVSFSLHPTLPVYDVCYSVTEGEPYRVGLIKITGNTRTKQDVILHESCLFPGDRFNKSNLEETEQRLRNTGYFNSVSVYTVRSQLDPLNVSEQYRDIYVDVSETSTGNLGLFLGFSSLDNLFGGVELSESNFYLLGIRNFLSEGFRCLRGGGEYLFLKANFGEKVTDYTIKWTKPHFLNTPWILGVELDKSINRALSKDYEVETYGGNVSTTYIITKNLRYGLYYRGSQTSLERKNKQDLVGPDPSTNKGFVSAAGTHLIYDSVSPPRNPKNGVRANVNFEISGLGGTYHFTKLKLSGSVYRQLTKKGVLKLRGEAQFIKPFSDTTIDGVPISERFFLGGETTVRGYKSFIIGPKYSENEPKGGLTSLLISEEFQYPLVTQPNVSAFVFMDSGFVGLEEYKIDIKELRGSAGFGLRFDVMNNVPVMMGFGWPFRPTEIFEGKKIDVTQRFFFALGGMF